VHSVKARKGVAVSRGVVPFIPNLIKTQKRVFSFAPRPLGRWRKIPRYAFHMRLSGLQCQSAPMENVSFLPLPEL
jgi:hypothetical protein